MDTYFRTRKSIRNFSTKNIDNNLIKYLIEAASYAPTTGGMQLYSVIITTDKTKKEELGASHFNQPAYVNAPAILTFCADFNRFVKWCVASSAQPGYDNIQSFVAAALDAVILAQQFCTIAEMQGLGTCYLGTTTYNPDSIAKVLNLPDYVVPVISVALGYPQPEATVDSNAEECKDRLPINAYVFDESYNDFSTNDIKRLYAQKEQREDNINFVKENNKETLAQVFTDVRYPKSNNEFFSKKFIDYLRSKKFL